MVTAKLLVAPASAAKFHSPCPVPGLAFSIVLAVGASSCGDEATGPVPAGLPLAAVAAVAVVGVSVSDPPVPAADREPSTVGAVAETVTL
jgi:hypothetical protein